MKATLGMNLKVRSMIFVAAEPISFFWPMRTFIHHNPLHGLEHLPFSEAVAEGKKLFHGRGFLLRSQYQEYLAKGKIDEKDLRTEIAAFLANHKNIKNIELENWLLAMITKSKKNDCQPLTLTNAEDIYSLLNNKPHQVGQTVNTEDIAKGLKQKLLDNRPLYEVVDALLGSRIGEEIDKLVIKSCLDFFDEGQSAWDMPGREQGLFKAWRDLALYNLPILRRGREVRRILGESDTPEDIIAYVMQQLGIPEEHWIDYFSRELSRLHGWVGFIRWRSSAKRYYWNQQYPGDLIDFMAIRLTLALALLNASKKRLQYNTLESLKAAINKRPEEMYLRYELHSGHILTTQVVAVEKALARKKPDLIIQTFETYVPEKRLYEAEQQVTRLKTMAQLAGEKEKLSSLALEDVKTFSKLCAACEQQEGMIWLRAMETKGMQNLLNDITPVVTEDSEKRPFAQALFCIDTRSERMRRHLEHIGDYQTFGIAGFFGVPVSLMELGKGNELHLCPVILTPKNVVLEIAASGVKEASAFSVLEKAVHDLKESVVTPFFTVEAIGLLFGFDMVGKTIAPELYHHWRKHLHDENPRAHLLLDKLSREEANSILRAAQRAVIVKALEVEFGLSTEKATDAIVRELRESALDNESELTESLSGLSISQTKLKAFVERLQNDYRINKSFTHWQLEELGRIGFSVDEQATYVSQALLAIGLKKNFSRLVLLVGHGSTSANNPYESALDCGACGGNHGLASGRVLAQMANKPQIRRRLQRYGINIPDNTWFVPGFHNTTTDKMELLDLELIPPAHLIYIERLRKGLTAASNLCAQERLPTLGLNLKKAEKASKAFSLAQRNAVDWSQVRPEWGLSGNAYFVIGRRKLTSNAQMNGRAFLHSYDYRIDPKLRLLENILTGPLVVGQWINMEHYFSTVDNDHYGSGSKVNHNVAGRFGVMTGNISDLRTGLPSQTVLKEGKPYHEPVRLMTLIEAPLEHAKKALDSVVSVKELVRNGWIRLLILDPEVNTVFLFENGEWQTHSQLGIDEPALEGVL